MPLTWRRAESGKPTDKASAGGAPRPALTDAEGAGDRRGAALREPDGDFLDFLHDAGLLDKAAAGRVRKVAQETGAAIETVILELGLLPAVQLRDKLAEFLGLPVVEMADFPPRLLLPDQLPHDFLLRHHMVVLDADEQTVWLAVANPHAHNELQAVRFATDREVRVKLALQSDIENWLRRHVPAPDTAAELTPEKVSDRDIQRLRDTASQAPVIRYVNRLIARAIAERASDVHLEPQANTMRVRFRLDGQLHEVEHVPPDLQAGVVSRIKILARLNIAERRLPQDGRTNFIVDGRNIDLRVSTMPVMHGENIVLRILDAGRVDLSLPALGFDAHQVRIFEHILERPNGMVLVTGPTGSGKTTTLYAALRRLNTPERKLFTVEDPIEYELPGISQIQVAPAIGLDFARALRSILRQDPDIIMVGEMRDLETARIGVQAALTGHLVLSTLHTNSACGSVTRLLDMGVKDYLLASSLVAVIAQRLVRRLCPRCATPAPEVAERIRAMGFDLEGALAPDEIRPGEPVGCEECHGTGYAGRMVVAEFLLVDDAVRGMIHAGADAAALEEEARRRGMRSLAEDGMIKVLKGHTSLREVLRVAQL